MSSIYLYNTPKYEATEKEGTSLFLYSEPRTVPPEDINTTFYLYSDEIQGQPKKARRHVTFI